MLAAHTFSLDRIKVDNTSIILLLVILLSPVISAITRIKYGDFEAEIDPKEVQKLKNEVSAHVINANEPPDNSEIEKRSTVLPHWSSPIQFLGSPSSELS
jgi:hypothetical protein